MGKAPFTNEGLKKRLKSITEVRKEMLENANELHVKLQPGNSKTGRNCYTVSLLPVIDCLNCKWCSHNCYDLKSDMIFKEVVNDRAKNSVIHALEPERYWKEIDMQIKALFVHELRINVGGDLTEKDFEYVAKLGRSNPKTSILFFTKNYKGINNFLEHHRFPKNVHPIMSAWKGLEMDNPHRLPESHILYEDGTTTAPEYGAYFCGGNCSECHFNGEGCWTLKKGEHVIFKAH